MHINKYMYGIMYLFFFLKYDKILFNCYTLSWLTNIQIEYQSCQTWQKQSFDNIITYFELHMFIISIWVINMFVDINYYRRNSPCSNSEAHLSLWYNHCSFLITLIHIHSSHVAFIDNLPEWNFESKIHSFLNVYCFHL